MDKGAASGVVNAAAAAAIARYFPFFFTHEDEPLNSQTA